MRETDACAIIAVLIVQCELARIFKLQRILKELPRKERK